MTLDTTILECKMNIGKTSLNDLEIINRILHTNATVNRIIFQKIPQQIFVLEVLIVLMTKSVENIIIQDL